MRVVFDTNALISATLLSRSVSRQAFDFAITSGIILTSIPTLNELGDVLFRPKFDRYLTEEERYQFLAAFLKKSEIVSITETITACRDAKDDQFLELAVNGRAPHISNRRRRSTRVGFLSRHLNPDGTSLFRFRNRVSLTLR